MAIPVLGRLWSAYSRALHGLGKRIAMPDTVVAPYLRFTASIFSTDETTRRYDHERRTLFVSDLDDDPDPEMVEEATNGLVFKVFSWSLAMFPMVCAGTWGLPYAIVLATALLGLSLFHGVCRVLDDEFEVDYIHVERPSSTTRAPTRDAEAAD